MSKNPSSAAAGRPYYLTEFPENSTGLHLHSTDVDYDVYTYKVARSFPMGLWNALIAAATVFVALRIFARWRSLGTIRIDDYVLLGSWICPLGFLIPYIVVIAKGDLALGFDGTFYPRSKEIHAAENVMKALYISMNFGMMSVTLAKTSLTILYWVLFDGVPSVQRWLLVFTVFFAIASTAQQLGIIFACRDFSEQWKLCMDYWNYIDTTDIAAPNSYWIMVQDWIIQLFHGGLSIVADLGVFAFSIPLLRRARLHKKDAVGIFAMFSLSLVTIGASAAAMITMTVYKALLPGLNWGCVELSTCVMVASMVSLRVLFNDGATWIRFKLFGVDKGTKERNGGGGLSATAIDVDKKLQR